MKKCAAMLLALWLFCLTAWGESAVYPEGFPLECPPGWQMSQAQMKMYSDPENGFYYLGYLLGDGLVVEVHLEDWREYYGYMSLIDQTEVKRIGYQQDLSYIILNTYDWCHCVEWIGEEEAAAPLAVFYMNDAEYGECYYANTLAEGFSTSFFAYLAEDSAAWTEEHYQSFRQLLLSFTPVILPMEGE